MTTVSQKSDFPDGEQLMILTFDTIHVPGDERSRTNPGHGYPASTERVVRCQVFTSRTAWEAEILRLETPKYGSKEPYIAGVFKPAKVQQTVNIVIG